MLLFYTAFPVILRKPGNNLRDAPPLGSTSSAVWPPATTLAMGWPAKSSWCATDNLRALAETPPELAEPTLNAAPGLQRGDLRSCAVVLTVIEHEV